MLKNNNKIKIKTWTRLELSTIQSLSKRFTSVPREADVKWLLLKHHSSETVYVQEHASCNSTVIRSETKNIFTLQEIDHFLFGQLYNTYKKYLKECGKTASYFILQVLRLVVATLNRSTYWESVLWVVKSSCYEV